MKKKIFICVLVIIILVIFVLPWFCIKDNIIEKWKIFISLLSLLISSIVAFFAWKAIHENKHMSNELLHFNNENLEYKKKEDELNKIQNFNQKIEMLNEKIQNNLMNCLANFDFAMPLIPNEGQEKKFLIFYFSKIQNNIYYLMQNLQSSQLTFDEKMRRLSERIDYENLKYKENFHIRNICCAFCQMPLNPTDYEAELFKQIFNKLTWLNNEFTRLSNMPNSAQDIFLESVKSVKELDSLAPLMLDYIRFTTFSISVNYEKNKIWKEYIIFNHKNCSK